jgi:hypothetical protein
MMNPLIVDWSAALALGLAGVFFVALVLVR